MAEYVAHGGIKIARSLYELVRDEIVPGTNIAPEAVWNLLDSIVQTLGPRNRALLEKRDALQAKIDTWLAARKGSAFDPQETAAFLREIGYLSPVGAHFTVMTANVDPEIASLAGPQLVVPVDNPRYALNAANARWGSLYDALYGTNVIADDGGADKGKGYNPVRGERVIAKANEFLDQAAALHGAKWADVTGLEATGGKLVCRLRNGGAAGLVDAGQFVGFRRAGSALTSVLLRHHGLHIDIVIDPSHPIGKQHPAGVKDVVLESALTTIMDCEDSVAAVDAADKTVVYRNWCGIMRGTLAASVAKGSGTIERRLNPDRDYTAPDGTTLTLPGRSLLLVRHVGSHVLTDAVTDSAGHPIAETFLDCVLTTLAALHDLKGLGALRNSRSGSMYIVKPKQHGPEEVALSVELFATVERAVGLPAKTLKIGIMYVERRSSVNL
jgi:malate synthase